MTKELVEQPRPAANEHETVGLAEPVELPLNGEGEPLPAATGDITARWSSTAWPAGPLRNARHDRACADRPARIEVK
jgi:hypothetical protein